jgi:5-methylcytosine-specific restriction enzyme A
MDERAPRIKIFENIKEEHIRQAIEKIDVDKIPPDNRSKKYDLLADNGKRYPPKVVLSVANEIATGLPLEVSKFSGGEQVANKFLKAFKFLIVQKENPNSDFEYKSYSWKKISNAIAVKRMDKSSFIHHGTGIPVDFRYFFNLDTMNVGEKIDVALSFESHDYSAHFEMVNEKNPRTRLMWRADLQSIIQNKFPDCLKFFKTHDKQKCSTPNLKMVKTREKNTYEIFFEAAERSSEIFTLQNIYSREDLIKRFNITDASIDNGIFKPEPFSSVWLFVTEEKTPDRTQYKDYFDDLALQFEGQKEKRTDHLIINHKSEGNEILVFYRKKRNEFSNFGFRYLGRFVYGSHTPNELKSTPTRFVLYPLENVPDDEEKETRTGESHYLPDKEGKERTRIQTTYERKPKLRAAAIEFHGTKCKICGFDFGEKYGQIGEGYIEIHHLIPHFSVKGEHEVDPKKDLVPVCSNCHRMIHRPKDGWYTIEDMQKMVR